jgi:prepilin-type N-terminal cleavage/methylation domain-containing protein
MGGLKNRGGFSLLELIVVVAILSLLMALSAPNLLRYKSKMFQLASEIDILLYMNSFKVAQASSLGLMSLKGNTHKIENGATYYSKPFPSTNNESKCWYHSRAVYKRGYVDFVIHVVPVDSPYCPKDYSKNNLLM